jgi:cohesin complex subunit SA-1/2
VGSVRLCAIKSLLPLCREMKDKLVLFTEKFKERLVSLVLDKDLEVSV